MAKALYDEVGGVARKVTKKYDGVAGVSRKVTKCYDGVAGVARQYFSSGAKFTKVSGYQIVKGIYGDIYDLWYNQPSTAGPFEAHFSIQSINEGEVWFYIYMDVDDGGYITGIKTDNPPPEIASYNGDWDGAQILNPETFAEGYIDFRAVYNAEGPDEFIIRIYFE